MSYIISKAVSTDVLARVGANALASMPLPDGIRFRHVVSPMDYQFGMAGLEQVAGVEPGGMQAGLAVMVFSADGPGRERELSECVSRFLA